MPDEESMLQLLDSPRVNSTNATFHICHVLLVCAEVCDSDPKQAEDGVSVLSLQQPPPCQYVFLFFCILERLADKYYFFDCRNTIATIAMSF